MKIAILILSLLFATSPAYGQRVWRESCVLRLGDRSAPIYAAAHSDSAIWLVFTDHVVRANVCEGTLEVIDTVPPLSGVGLSRGQLIALDTAGGTIIGIDPAMNASIVGQLPSKSAIAVKVTDLGWSALSELDGQVLFHPAGRHEVRPLGWSAAPPFRVVVLDTAVFLSEGQWPFGLIKVDLQDGSFEEIIDAGVKDLGPSWRLVAVAVAGSDIYRSYVDMGSASSSIRRVSAEIGLNGRYDPPVPAPAVAATGESLFLLRRLEDLEVVLYEPSQ